jgi:hypothetical protein
MKLLIAAASLGVCASLVAGCGNSRHVTPSERAAIMAAQRSNGYLRAFPNQLGTINCRIPMGGPAPGGFLAGQCTTSVSTTAQRIRLDFTEQTDGGSGGFTLILDRHNRIISSHWHGDVPQMQN